MCLNSFKPDSAYCDTPVRVWEQPYKEQSLSEWLMLYKRAEYKPKIQMQGLLCYSQTTQTLVSSAVVTAKLSFPSLRVFITPLSLICTLGGGRVHEANRSVIQKIHQVEEWKCSQQWPPSIWICGMDSWSSSHNLGYITIFQEKSTVWIQFAWIGASKPKSKTSHSILANFQLKDISDRKL